MAALQDQEQPPLYSHDPETLYLPSVPQKEPPLFSSVASERVHLPDFKSLRLPESNRHHLSPPSTAATTTNTTTTNGDAGQWNPLPLNQAVFPSVPSGSLRAGPEDVGSPMDTAADDHTSYSRAASVSMEDPDVRTAAEALTGLRSPRTVALRPNGTTSSTDPEPLLSLLTSSHPWLGGTINGSLSAYATTKNYSPRFIRNVAESVERNIGTPVANTVNAVGKKTGVEDGLRRYLGTHRRPSDLEQEDDATGGSKRRRIALNTSPADVEQGLSTPLSLRTRTDSQASQTESLPAYDDQRSPRYEEVNNTDIAIAPQSAEQTEERRNWSTQLMITTSGLGVALNDTALKNLKFCLSLLRGATQSIGDFMIALKTVIEDYEKTQKAGSQQEIVDGNGCSIDREERCRQLADKMKELGTAIWQTLKDVVDKVSKYTGGALPANAQQIVRSQLTSIPFRWQRSTSAASEQGTSSSSGEVKNANRMLAFAKEGLDMMGQVSTVVDGTLVSAERWLDRMGKRPRREEDSMAANEKAGYDKVMLGVDPSGGEAYGVMKPEKN